RDNVEYRITSFDIKTAYELPDDQGRLDFGLKHIEDAISNPGELTFQQFKDDAHSTNKPLDGRKFNNTIVQVGADKKFWQDRVMASLMTYWRTNDARFFTTSGTFMDFTTGSNPDTDRVTQKTRLSDLIWQLSYDDQWDWLGNQSLLGMELQDGKEHGFQQDAFQGIVRSDSLLETDRSANVDGAAIFWRETVKFFEKVFLHVGMRHDFSWLKTKDALTPGDSISRRWDNSSVSTGVTVKPVKAMDLFANYSQGFRTPTVSEITPFSGTISTDLDPERSDSYETGVRLRAKDKATLKCSYFLIDVNDEILWDSTKIGPTAPWGQNINVGKSRRTGIELRLDTNPIQEINCYGSYTWTQAWTLETNADGTLPDGRSLGQVPENRATFGALVYPLKRLGEPFDGLRFAINGICTGRQHPTSYESAAQNILDATGGAGHFIKAYTVWNTMVSYVWRKQEIYFKINNVFDQKYYSRAVSATSFGTAIYPAGTYTFVDPGAPREYLFGLRYEI
ncbi:MAG: TonB-dependent receptor, partial [Candidatus Omnitrophica bacterium]|nr:TonB-dependent receptor [Candidatus Omnitrophota bacterium]